MGSNGLPIGVTRDRQDFLRAYTWKSQFIVGATKPSSKPSRRRHKNSENSEIHIPRVSDVASGVT